MVSLRSNYFLLLIDIQNSTGAPARAMNEKMKLLEATLTRLNKEFRNEAAIPLSISYGDEIAGLFRSPREFYNIVMTVRKVLHPTTGIRFSAVKGKISVESNDIRKVGGPVFKRASTAIRKLKEDYGYASWQLGNTVRDRSLGSLCEISNALINDMSGYQRDVYELLNAGLSQKEIAKRLGKYTQSVWDAVQRSKAAYVIEAQKTINLILAEGK